MEYYFEHLIFSVIRGVLSVCVLLEEKNNPIIPFPQTGVLRKYENISGDVPSIYHARVPSACQLSSAQKQQRLSACRFPVSLKTTASHSALANALQESQLVHRKSLTKQKLAHVCLKTSLVLASVASWTENSVFR